MRDLILSAVEEINAEGCVTLTASTRSDADHVSIQLGSDYSSHFGRQGGAQKLTVVADKIHRGSVMHELMHALGKDGLDVGQMFGWLVEYIVTVEWIVNWINSWMIGWLDG